MFLKKKKDLRLKNLKYLKTKDLKKRLNKT